MKKPYPHNERHPFRFKPMWFWLKWFWHVCFQCEELFKGEDGWMTNVLNHETEGTIRIYCCPGCAKENCNNDPVEIRKEYSRRRDNYQLRRRVLG
jgi:hypothetical protein